MHECIDIVRAVRAVRLLPDVLGCGVLCCPLLTPRVLHVFHCAGLRIWYARGHSSLSHKLKHCPSTAGMTGLSQATTSETYASSLQSAIGTLPYSGMHNMLALC